MSRRAPGGQSSWSPYESAAPAPSSRGGTSYGDTNNPITGSGYSDGPAHGRRARPGSGTNSFSVSPITTPTPDDGYRGARSGGGATGGRGGLPAPSSAGVSRRDQVWEEKRRQFMERKATEGSSGRGSLGSAGVGSYYSKPSPTSSDRYGSGYGASAAPRERDILDEFAAQAGIPGPGIASLPRNDSFGSYGRPTSGASGPRSPTTMAAMHVQSRRDQGFEDKMKQYESRRSFRDEPGMPPAYPGASSAGMLSGRGGGAPASVYSSGAPYGTSAQSGGYGGTAAPSAPAESAGGRSAVRVSKPPGGGSSFSLGWG